MEEISQPLNAEDVDVSIVFGQLDDDTKAKVLEELRRAYQTLEGIRDDLALEGEPLTVERYLSGQTEVVTALKTKDGKLTFEAALRPHNFFSDTPWQPGRAPRSMRTDAWNVDGAVQVMVRRLVNQHKYTIQETPEEIEEQRFENPVEAAAGLAGVADRLAELARSREPTVAAWDPEPAA